MSEESGDKTEQPTDRRLSEALGKGQFAKSQEIQTAFVLIAGVWALQSYGGQLLKDLTGVFQTVFSISTTRRSTSTTSKTKHPNRP